MRGALTLQGDAWLSDLQHRRTTIRRVAGIAVLTYGRIVHGRTVLHPVIHAALDIRAGRVENDGHYDGVGGSDHPAVTLLHHHQTTMTQNNPRITIALRTR